MLDQCLALLELKLLMMRRAWTSSKWVSLGVMIALGVLGGVLALGLAAAMFLLGMRWLPSREPFTVLVAIDIVLFCFLFVWFWGLILEVQRADVIDLRPLLFLPISLPTVFLMNFAVSLFSVSFLIFIPAVSALLAGLALRHGFHMLLGIPLVLLFFLMLAAWAYYARGLLAIVMENKRRRRLLLTVLPLVFVLLGQMPNIVLHLSRNSGLMRPDMPQAEVEQLVQYVHLVVPLGWLPYGVAELLRFNFVPLILGMAGFSAIMALGLALGFRSTLAYYTGAYGGGRRAEAGKTSRTRRAPLTARGLPFFSEELAAMTWAEFLGYARHPQIRLLMIMPLCMGLLLLLMHRSNTGGAMWNPQGPWTPLLVLLWPFFNFSLMLFNLFGVDKQAFRGLILLPVPRRRFFLAKNLALFPFVGGMSALMVGLGAAIAHTPWRYVLISMTQIVQLYLMYCIVGNLLSVYFPYRIMRDSLRARGNHPLLFLLGLASTVLTGVMILPTTLCMMLDGLVERWWGWQGPLAGWFAALGLLGFTVACYRRMLIHAGDLLLSREQGLLDTLVRDRE